MHGKQNNIPTTGFSGYTLLEVILQGMDKNYRYTGSYDEVRIGLMKINDILKLVDYVSSINYPSNYISDELCPIGVFLKYQRATLCVYYYGSGRFSVRLIDDVSSSEKILDEDIGVTKVKEYIKVFSSSRDSIEKLLGSAYSREYYITVLTEYCDLTGDDNLCFEAPTNIEVSSKRIGPINTTSIKQVAIKRGGLFRKPKLIIYYWHNNELRKMEYKLPGNEAVEKAYNILNTVLPNKVKIK